MSTSHLFFLLLPSIFCLPADNGAFISDQDVKVLEKEADEMKENLSPSEHSQLKDNVDHIRNDFELLQSISSRPEREELKNAIQQRIDLNNELLERKMPNEATRTVMDLEKTSSKAKRTSEVHRSKSSGHSKHHASSEMHLSHKKSFPKSNKHETSHKASHHSKNVKSLEEDSARIENGDDFSDFKTSAQSLKSFNHVDEGHEDVQFNGKEFASTEGDAKKSEDGQRSLLDIIHLGDDTMTPISDESLITIHPVSSDLYEDKVSMHRSPKNSRRSKKLDVRGLEEEEEGASLNDLSNNDEVIESPTFRLPKDSVFDSKQSDSSDIVRSSSKHKNLKRAAEKNRSHSKKSEASFTSVGTQEGAFKTSLRHSNQKHSNKHHPHSSSSKKHPVSKTSHH